jgi:hypothetical protein
MFPLTWLIDKFPACKPILLDGGLAGAKSIFVYRKKNKAFVTFITGSCLWKCYFFCEENAIF